MTLQLLSTLSHELRTPLSGVLGYCQLLAQTKLDPTQQIYINQMTTCSLQLVQIFNDVLDMSKLMAGKTEINPSCVSITEIIEEVKCIVGHRITEKQQKFIIILNKSLSRYIITDKQKLVQILVNLISNASKFTPNDGKITLQVNNKAADVIEFSVEDNGIGISEQDQKNLFEPFSQVNPSDSKNGAGLGLAICKKLVTMLKGEINVESYPEKGSIFRFTIQYEKYELYEQKIEKKALVMKNQYVLVVDNDADSRMNITDILFLYNTRPIISPTSKEAQKLVSSNKYNFACVVINISLIGLDFAKFLRKNFPELPVILISPLSKTVDNVNFEYVVNPPVNKLKLIDTIVKAVQKGEIVSFQLEEDGLNIEAPVIRILVAEDVQYNLTMLQKMLSSMGYNSVDGACDGQEAIEKIIKTKYDILLLDLTMPKIDGFGVAEFVVKNSKTTKIAVITASIKDIDKQRCKELGIKYFIPKPFNMGHLRIIMNRMITGTIKIT